MSWMALNRPSSRIVIDRYPFGRGHQSLPCRTAGGRPPNLRKSGHLNSAETTQKIRRSDYVKLTPKQTAFQPCDRVLPSRRWPTQTRSFQLTPCAIALRDYI
jgi:hypothetical protein